MLATVIFLRCKWHTSSFAILSTTLGTIELPSSLYAWLSDTGITKSSRNSINLAHFLSSAVWDFFGYIIWKIDPHGVLPVWECHFSQRPIHTCRSHISANSDGEDIPARSGINRSNQRLRVSRPCFLQVRKLARPNIPLERLVERFNVPVLLLRVDVDASSSILSAAIDDLKSG